MTPAQLEDQMIEDIAQYRHDPLGYALYAFPWNEPGTELAGIPGPRKWQAELLDELGQKLRAGVPEGEAIAQALAILEAVSSGHGIGKSALVAILIMWAMSTLEDTRGVVTANTEGQLKTKTWPELAKWHRMAINSHWFIFTATALYSADKKHERTWRIDQVTWSETNTEAFAGLHNKGKRILLIFDEASAIPDKIWEVSEGALTDEDTEILWFAFGNPTRNTGRFFQCFNKLRHRWGNRRIDSRDVEGTNKAQIARWEQDYGDDSDFFRVRVRGLHPRASSLQLFSTELIEEAQRREARSQLGDPLIMTLDIARGGDDNCVFRFRRGLDARTIPPVTVQGSEVKDSMKLVAKAVQLLDEYKPDAFFYDGTGVGGPVGDRIRQLGYPVTEVQFGRGSPNPKYANFRAFMYMQAKDWLQAGGAIDSSPELEQDLTSLEYTHDKKDRIILEAKEDQKEKLNGASPDHGDAFAMLFAYPVAPTIGRGKANAGRAESEWDPFRD